MSIFDIFDLRSRVHQVFSTVHDNFQEVEDKEVEEASNLKKVGPVGDRKKKEGKKEPYWFKDGK